MDIIVTTPKNKSQEAAEEAEYCKKNGGGYYFRVFPVKRYPRNIKIGDKVFYIDGGYVRGFCLIDACGLNFSKTPCAVTGEVYPPGYIVFMKAESWVWINPVLMKGFQGFRYFKNDFEVKEKGMWLDSMPNENKDI